MSKKIIFTSLILMATATPAMAITRIKCFSPIHGIKTGSRITFPSVSSNDCICTDQGTFCKSEKEPVIKDTNLMANCLELDGKYDEKYCLLPSDNGRSILWIQKEKR